MKVYELESYFDRLLPVQLSCDWDNDGLMIAPDSDRCVRKALITLDLTQEAAEKAVEIGADAIFTHHPFIFRGLKSICDTNARACLVMKLISHGISVFSYHTRLDSVQGGVNDILASLLMFENVAPLGEGELAMARIGDVRECDISEFASDVKSILHCPVLTVATTKKDRRIKRAAVLGGACDKEFIHGAIAAGADVLLTGDASYNAVIDANLDGLDIICAGHYFTEAPVLAYFEKHLSSFGIETNVFECGYFDYI